MEPMSAIMLHHLDFYGFLEFSVLSCTFVPILSGMINNARVKLWNAGVMSFDDTHCTILEDLC